MGRSLEQMIAAETPENQAKIERRYTELVEEAKTLAAVRKATECSQEEVAKRLKVKQPSISRLEHQSDMFISTLREYIEAAGGKLRLLVELPARPPLEITSLGDIVSSRQGKRILKQGRQPARNLRGKEVGKKKSVA